MGFLCDKIVFNHRSRQGNKKATKRQFYANLNC